MYVKFNKYKYFCDVKIMKYYLKKSEFLDKIIYIEEVWYIEIKLNIKIKLFVKLFWFVIFILCLN